MIALYEAALDVQSFCESMGWRFCLVGGIAVARWGQPRATQDVDLHLMAGYGDESEFVRPLFDHFHPRTPDAEAIAFDFRVVLVEAANGVALDIILAALDFEDRAIDRASKFKYAEGVDLLTASAEDLLVMKAFAGRPQDVIDLQGIAIRQGKALDWSLIESELRELSQAADQDLPSDLIATARALAEDS